MSDKPVDPNALVYCLVADINDFINVTIDANSTPSTTQVEKLIRRKQEIIDKRTKHAFRPRQVLDELHDLEGEWEIGRGHEIGLRHRHIATFDEAQGDKIQVWNGNEYQDILDGTTIQDGIFVNYLRGTLEFKVYGWYWGSKYRFRFSYRYGEDVVPTEITEVCVKLVVMDIVNSSMFFEHLPYGGDRDSIGAMLNRFKEETELILQDYDEVVAFY